MNTLDPKRPIVKAALVALRGEGTEREMLWALAEGKNYWVLPGGKQDPNETIEEAFDREIREELGVAATNVVYLGHVSGKTPDGERDITEHLFRGEVPTEPQPSAEIVKFGWFGKAAIEQMGDEMTPLTRDKILPFLDEHEVW